MINKVIATAVKLFIRSQVTEVEDLQLKISGRNRQILTGYIPEVFLASRRAVYRGLYLRQIELQASNIGFNVKEVLKRKPLRLIEPILVDINLLLDESDLQASLTSPLLSGGLNDFLASLLSAKGIARPQEKLADCEICWHEIALAGERISLKGTLRDTQDATTDIDIVAGIALANSHTLALSPLKIVTIPPLNLNDRDRLEIDFGTSVAISQLAIAGDKLLCEGKITIV